MATVDLMAAANFDENDLMANRQGHMSDNQIARLQRRQLRSIVIYGILISAGLGGLLVLILEAIHEQLSSSGVGRVLIFAIVLSGLIAYALYQWRQLRGDIVKGIVASARGEASLRLVGTRNLSYIFRLDKDNFEISRKLYKCISRGSSTRFTMHRTQDRYCLSSGYTIKLS